MSRNPLGEQIDESELDAELEQLEQEKTDAQLLGAGPTPIGGELIGADLPAVSHGPGKHDPFPLPLSQSSRCTISEWSIC